MTLAQLIHEFATAHPAYADPRQAWGRCDGVSNDFISFCVLRGYTGGLKTYTFYATRKQPSWMTLPDRENPDPENYIVDDAEGKLLRNESGVIMCSWHCIVDAGHILIDFTARQYSTKLAYPHIVAIEEKQLAMTAKAGA